MFEIGQEKDELMRSRNIQSIQEALVKIESIDDPLTNLITLKAIEFQRLLEELKETDKDDNDPGMVYKIDSGATSGIGVAEGRSLIDNGALRVLRARRRSR